jgi:predicted transcriptional regulator
VENRSEIELIALIIRTAFYGATITKMMYRLCMSHNQLSDYLLILRENDMLLQHSYEERTFIATDKGKYFLQIYTELNELSTTVVWKRNIIAHSYHALLTNMSITRYTIYRIRYLLSSIRSSLEGLID